MPEPFFRPEASEKQYTPEQLFLQKYRVALAPLLDAVDVAVRQVRDAANTNSVTPEQRSVVDNARKAVVSKKIELLHEAATLLNTQCKHITEWPNDINPKTEGKNNPFISPTQLSKIPHCFRMDLSGKTALIAVLGNANYMADFYDAEGDYTVGNNDFDMSGLLDNLKT